MNYMLNYKNKKQTEKNVKPLFHTLSLPVFSHQLFQKTYDPMLTPIWANRHNLPHHASELWWIWNESEDCKEEVL